jgi:hypothetical protein
MATIKTILVLGLLAAAVYVGAQVIPPYFANYQFQDTLDNEARLGTYSTKGDEVIRQAVFKRAQELELPLAVEDIKLMRVGPSGNAAAVTIEADYTVHVELPGYPMDLHFHPASKNQSAF